MDNISTLEPTVEESVLPRELWPNIDHLVFQDDEPVDRIFTERQQILLHEPLYTDWEGPPEHGKFVALCNVGVFAGPHIPHQVPDITVATEVEVPRDVRPRENHSYLIWVYGKPPDLLIEIVSDKRGGELTYKLGAYARFGVAYYVVFDPDRYLGEQVLTVFRREGSAFAPMSDAWFPILGLGLTLWTGVFEGVEGEWLRWCRRDGSLIRTGPECKNQLQNVAEQAQQQAESAQQQAEFAQQQAESAQQQAELAQQQTELAQQQAATLQSQQERLVAQLRALGIEPDLGGKHAE